MTFASDALCDDPVPDSDLGCAPTDRPSARRAVARLFDRWSGSATLLKPMPPLSGVSRVLDIAGASAMLVIALPVLLILALLLKLDSRGPLFFVQRRIGRGGREFPCIKFRTMCCDADVVLQSHLAKWPDARLEWQRDHKLRNDPRITRLGRTVRKLSLDEFPQLINVLRGEMSLVGPRPIVWSEVARYGRYFEEYCAVRPGLTGLWQVSGRNDVSYRRRVSMDCYYVRNRTLLLDLKILLKTAPVVLGTRGSY